MPFTLNQYSYCFNSPLILVDLDGAWPQWMEDAGQDVSDGWNNLCDGVSYVWNNYIYGTDIIETVTTPKDGMMGVYTTQTHTKHTGGFIIVGKVNNGQYEGISLNIPSINISEDTSIGVPTSIGLNWGNDNMGLDASVGVNLKIKGVGIEGAVDASLNSNDWFSAGAYIEGIYKNDGYGFGAKIALNPFSNWDGYLYKNKNLGNDETWRSEVGAYIKALMPELVAVVILAALFPAAIPALAGAMGKALSIERLLDTCGI